MFRYNFFFCRSIYFFMRNRKKTTEHNTYAAYTCKYNKNSDCFSIVANRIDITIQQNFQALKICGHRSILAFALSVQH